MIVESVIAIERANPYRSRELGQRRNTENLGTPHSTQIHCASVTTQMTERTLTVAITMID
jgi:hypothetical protein